MRALALLALLAGCGGEGRVFIALQSDFAAFQTWPKIFVGDGALEDHAAGPRYGYVKDKPSNSRYAVGSIIVKTAGAITAPSLVAVMNKTSTGWVYEEFTPKDGKYTLFARGSLCSNCHEGAKAKDFLFTR